MKIVVDINHPAHVHYFKNFIRAMEKKGHAIMVTASHKDLSYRLLDDYGFAYEKLGSYGTSVIEKAVNVPLLDVKMYNAVKKFGPDLFLGFGSIRAAHVSRLLRRPCINLDDSEPSPVEHILYVPYTDTILTPECFRKDFGKKHVRYNGYIELAYLHPNYFKPDPAALEGLGVTKNDPFVIMRFVAWKAGHDVGKRGFDRAAKVRAVRALEKHAAVFITSELRLPPELETYRIKASPSSIHHLLYYSRMLLGDSQTMTTESAILGTPAIRCNTFAGPNDMGNFTELEGRYGLIYSYADPDPGIEKAVDIIQRPGLKSEWSEKRDRLLKEKTDITSFLIDYVERYPAIRAGNGKNN
jgi:uncharacterized protein